MTSGHLLLLTINDEVPPEIKKRVMTKEESERVGKPDDSLDRTSNEGPRGSMPDLDGLWKFIKSREPGSRHDRVWMEKMLEFVPDKSLRATTCREYLLELRERIRKAGRHHVRIGMTDDDYDRKTHRAMSIVLTYSVFEKLDFRVDPLMKDYYDWLTALRHLVCHALEFEILDGPGLSDSENAIRTEDGVIPLTHSEAPFSRLPLTHAGVKHNWLESGFLPSPFNPIWFHVFQPVWLEVESNVCAAIAALAQCEYCRPNSELPSANFQLAGCQLFGNCREWRWFKFPCDINLLEERRVYKSKIDCPSSCGKNRAKRECKIG